jgi:hypothetical protein
VTREIALLPRTPARVAAAVGALAAFSLAGYVSAAEAMPEYGIYDGFWMLLGASMALIPTAALVRRWPRERSLPAVVAAAAIGMWVPIVYLALREHIGILPRLRGAWHLMGGDVVSAAVPAGVACLWFAVRGPGPTTRR